MTDFPPRSVIIVGGVHGAGKSTLCRQMCAEKGLTYLSPQEVESTSKMARLEWRNLLRYLRKMVAEQLIRGDSFCFEHVMSGHYVDRLIKDAKAASFSIHLIYVNVDGTNRAVNRIEQRVREGGHDVDRELLRQRLFESRSNFWHNYRHRADKWFLFDNSKKTYQKIACGGHAQKLQISDQEMLKLFVATLENPCEP